MATCTFSVAGGSWNTNGAWLLGAQPTAADDVVATAASGSVSVTAGSVCRSMDLTGFAATLNGSGDLSIGDGSGGACKLAGTISGTWTTSFVSTSNNGGTGWALTSGGKVFPGAVSVNGAGNKMICQDAFSCGTNTLTVTSGAFFGNGQTITAGTFSGTGSTTRTVDITNCAVNLSSTATPWNFTTVTSLTLTTTGSTITLSGAGAAFSSGNSQTYNNVTFTGGGSCVLQTATSATSIATLTYVGTASKTNQLQFSTSGYSVTTKLAVTSNSAVNRVLVTSTTRGTQRTVNCTGATVNVDNTAAAAGSSVDFMDITITGSPTWTPLNSTLVGDCGGNGGAVTTNATATLATTYNGTASDSWSTVARWSGGRVPLPQDNVTVVAITAGTLTVDMPRLGADIDFTGTTRTVSFGVVTEMYGSWTNATGMTISGTSITTLAGRSTHTLTTNGITFTQPLNFGGPGGVYTLQDALTCNRSSASAITFDNNSTFNSNSQSVTISGANGGVVVQGSATLTTGTATWTFNTTGAVTFFSVATATVNASNLTILLANTSASTRTFAGGGKTYGTLTYTVAGSTGILAITGNNTWTGTWNLSDATNARNIQIAANSTQTFTGAANPFAAVLGTSGKLVTFVSSTPSTAYTFTRSGTLVSCDFVSLTDSTAAGVVPFYAGANSTNVARNTNWTFTVPPAFYVGLSGNVPVMVGQAVKRAAFF